MSAFHELSVQEDPSAIKKAEDSIKRYREDDDPQTVFFLDPAPAFDGINDLHVTRYNWATKIEQTVQSYYGKKEKRHGIQLSWDRASFRAKLVDNLLRKTPWCMLVVDGVKDLANLDLTGDYYHDKELYQKEAHGYLHASLPQVPVARLRVLSKYIAETLVLGQDKLKGLQRFAVTLSLPSSDAAPLAQPGLRTVIVAFDRKADDGKKVEVTGTMYEAKLNSKLLHEQKFDEKMLDLGRPLVAECTLDIAA